MADNKEMKGLAKDTLIYGLSSIIGKFLNYLLVPYYTYVLASQADYGIVGNLYAWTALLLVILVYGMETGFFNYANKTDQDPNLVYKTAMTSIAISSIAISLLCHVFSHPIADWLGYSGHYEYITILIIIVSLDAFSSIPFAYLRYRKRPIRFAALKLLFVILNILFNIFFLNICPRFQDSALISFWYNPTYGVGYVLVANLLATAIQTLCLLPYILEGKYQFSWSLLKQMLRYSLPLLVLGVAGIMNQTLDKILYPMIHPAILTTDPDILAMPIEQQVQAELGIYTACFKVAMVMMMFTQAFRYAYEPYVFAKHKDSNSVERYADAMKYYLLFSYLILLGVICYLDIFKFIINPKYWGGLRVVPFILWAYVFQGIYFNLSFWYKLTDRTQWGAWFSIIGVVITLALQLIFVPRIGYMASAISSTVCYFVIMLLSYFVGKRYLTIPYDMKSMGAYTLLTIGLLAIFYIVRAVAPQQYLTPISLCVGTMLIGIYLMVLIKKDFPLSSLPVVGKYFKKK